jgi:NhaP-type Na+/H+ or K+/H+ antiporter
MADMAHGRQDDDISHMAKFVVRVFFSLVIIVVIGLLVGMLHLGLDWKKVEEPAKFLMTVLSSVLLPVVTLVIGYHFGRRSG